MYTTDLGDLSFYEFYSSPSHNSTLNPTQIIPAPTIVMTSGRWTKSMESTTPTKAIVSRLATEDVVGPQTPIRIIRPAF